MNGSKEDGQLEEEIEAQMKDLRRFLETLGAIAFCSGLTILPLHKPQLFAFFVLLVLTVAGGCSAKHDYPSAVRSLRDKENKTDAENVILIRIEEKYFSWKAAFRTVPLFIISWIFLLLIGAGKIKDF